MGLVFRIELTRLGLNLSSKLEWIRNILERILRASGADHENRSVIEHSPDKTLIYPNRFDFSKHRLDSAALNEPHLDYDAFVSNAEL